MKAGALEFCKRLSRRCLGRGSARQAVTLLAIVALAVAFSACGSGDSGEDSGTSAENAKPTFAEEHPGSADYGSPPLEFEADPGGDLAYTADEVTAKEGNVTIEFTNPQSTPHNVVMEALPSHGSVSTNTVENGFAAVTITLNTKEKFIFYCSIPGHRKAGMEGIVRIKPR
jgi:plastocyanin